MKESATGGDPTDALIGMFGRLAPHWPFLLMAFTFGTIVQYFKYSVWTEEFATKSKLAWWMRASQPAHGAIMGAVFGLLGWLIGRDNMIASPGVHGCSSVVIYYMAAGASSAWVHNAIKHYLRTKGLIPPESIKPRPSYVSLVDVAEAPKTLAPPPETPTLPSVIVNTTVDIKQPDTIKKGETL